MSKHAWDAYDGCGLDADTEDNIFCSKIAQLEEQVTELVAALDGIMFLLGGEEDIFVKKAYEVAKAALAKHQPHTDKESFDRAVDEFCDDEHYPEQDWGD